MRAGQLQICLQAVFWGILAVQALFDIWRREILLWLLLPGMAAGAVWQVAVCRSGAAEWLCALAPGALVFAVSAASRGKVGAGDGWATLYVGLWVGCWAALFALLTALTGVLLADAAIGLLRRGPRKAGRGRAYPFVPFLLAGAAAVQLCR